MANKEILERVIQEAVNGGWDLLENYEAVDWWVDDVSGTYDGSLSLAFGVRGGPVYGLVPSTMFIFNHDFAKALWGEHEPTDYGTGAWQPWEYHLQQMVIAEDPIEYLGENIDG